MRQLRICIVALLAVLLPVRGIMAATMLCAPSSELAPVAASLGVRADLHAHDRHAHDMHAHDMHAHHTVAAEEAAHPHEHHDHDHDHDRDTQTHATHAKCNACSSSSCASPPLPSASSGIDAHGPLTALCFADVSAPAPTFLSDGQERPPRSC